jgi:circadian clock protein KaiC
MEAVTLPVGVRGSRLIKAPTGIKGLDELTLGGLPAGRTTLVCGGAGCGKTLLGAAFLVHGAVELGERGVFMSFEEQSADLIANVASLGYDLERLIAEDQVAIDHVRVERSEIEETGEYDLEALFIRLNYAIDSIGARRVVLDTIETLFGGLSNEAVLRAELRRLFGWLKQKGMTAIVTGERGHGQLTRHGLEDYVSDCVILLDHRVQEQVSTRRLRIVKYRGSSHATNEYPFLIDNDGFSVVPISSAGLDHAVSEERVSTGIEGLDQMPGGQGFYRGSTILVSGMAGSGKTSVATQFADAACRRGERCLYFAFEESPAQIIRNMRSIGFDLGPWVERDLLRFSANRPGLCGLEMHLAIMHRQIDRFAPQVAILDPISSLITAGELADVRAALLRLVDLLKSRGVTTLLTNLTHGLLEAAESEVGMSSLIDTWLLLLHREMAGEHNRQLFLLKSRGMAHSNQVREFLLTDHGIELRPGFLGPEGMLTGSARLAHETREKARTVADRQEAGRRRRALARRRRRLEQQIEALRAELEAEAAETEILTGEAAETAAVVEAGRFELARGRKSE